MNAPHTPTTKWGDTACLKQLVAKSQHGPLVRRLSAIRYRLLSFSPGETCELIGITTETLRIWILKWNEGGIEALRSKPIPGRPRVIDEKNKDLVIEKIQRNSDDGKPISAIAAYGYLHEKKSP